MTLHKLAVFSLVCGIAAPALAATPVPHAFTAGTPAKAAEVNANFQAVVDQIAAAVPAGTVLPYVGATAPPGFLLCDGSEVSRTDQAALFALIGITYGMGDGVSTFNLPDLRSRLVVGAGQGPFLTNRPVGTKGGEEAHTLTVAELAAHDHGANTGNQSANHTHALGVGAADTTTNVAGVQRYPDFVGGLGSALRSTTGVNNDHTHGIASSGSGTPHNTMPPFVALNWIIKT